MGWNLTLDVGLDCVSCHESDRCTDDCICPACWWPARYDSVERDLAAAAWKFFAPVGKALNDEEIAWGWATEEGHKRKVTCSLELLIPATDEWCEVSRWGDAFVASWWTMTRGSREQNIAPEPVMLDELKAETPDEVVNFIENCILYRKEVAR
jgi:hypothetical protein